jgi:hypothetical protein
LIALANSAASSHFRRFLEDLFSVAGAAQTNSIGEESLNKQEGIERRRKAGAQRRKSSL